MAALVAMSAPAANDIDTALEVIRSATALLDIKESDTPQLSRCLNALSSKQVQLKDVPVLPLFVGWHVLEQDPPVKPSREALEKLLAAGADPNAVHPHLKFASLGLLSSYPELVRMLLDAGAKPDEGRDLGMAVSQGNPESVQLLLDAGASPNVKGDIMPPLHIAAYDGNADICRMLLAAGAEVNKRAGFWSEEQQTALDTAISFGKLEAARLLREAGGVCNEQLFTPLYLAIFFGDEEETLRLLQGVDINAVVSNQRTPLSLAAGLHHTSLCVKLLEKGAKVSEPDASGQTPLMYAAQHHDTETCRVLLAAGADPNEKNEGGMGVLGIALFSDKGYEETAKLLLAAGADPNGCGFYRQPLLHIALQTMSMDMTQLLVDAGANVNATDAQGNTALAFLASCQEKHAAQVKLPEKAKLLLAAGADPLARSDGRTPLSIAISSGNVSMCEILIGIRAGINEPDVDGDSPLLQAIQNRNIYSDKDKTIKIVRMLIDAGAELEDEMDSGRKAFAEAVDCGYAEICTLLAEKGSRTMLRRWPALHLAAILGKADEIKRLQAAGAKMNAKFSRKTPLIYAAHMGQIEACRALIEAGVDVNQDHSLWTPLGAAVDSNKIDTCRALIEMGADVNKRVARNTPLHLAIVKEYPALAMALIDAGADVNAVDEDKRNALHLALLEYKENESEDLVRKLIAAGVDVNGRDKDGCTPLHYLVAFYYFEPELRDQLPIFRIMLEAGADLHAKNNNGHSVQDWIDHPEHRNTVRSYSALCF